jgi:hypothetical protein
MWDHLVAVETAVMKENRFKGRWKFGCWEVQCPLCELWVFNCHPSAGPEDLATAHVTTCQGFNREYDAMLYRMRVT